MGYVLNIKTNACYATGYVTATSVTAYSASGGLVGLGESSSIEASYATGYVTTTSDKGAYIGGLVGWLQPVSSVIACYARGDVTAISSSLSPDNADASFAGGLVGENWESSIEASYATGNASSSAVAFYSFAGGFVGRNWEGSITDCYATGNVSSSSEGRSYVGGFLGLNGAREGTNMGSINNGYYNNTATIEGGTLSPDGLPITQSELQSQSSSDAMSVYATWDELELDEDASEGIEDRSQPGDATNDLVWDFGTSTQYPALKIDFDGDADAAEKATVAEFGPQRSPKFRRPTYDFVVGADDAVGSVVDIVRVGIADYSHTISYSIESQEIDGALATTSGFAFTISDKDEGGINVGELRVAADALLRLDQVFTLSIQVTDDNGDTDAVEAIITVVLTDNPRLINIRTLDQLNACPI